MRNLTIQKQQVVQGFFPQEKRSLNKFFDKKANLIDFSKNISVDFEKVIDVLKHDYECKKIRIKRMTDKSEFTFAGHTEPVWCIKIINLNYIVSGSLDGNIRIWAINDKKCLKILESDSPVYSVLTCYKGKILSGSKDGKIRLWDISTGKLIHTILGHKKTVFSLEMVDNNIFASQSSDGTVKFWNINSLQCIHTLDGCSDYITNLVIKNNRFLITQALDKSIILYDIEKKSIVRKFEDSGNPAKYIRAFTLLENGLLASGNNNFSIEIWNLNTGEKVDTLKGHNNFINALSILNNGLLVSASGDNTIKIWDLEKSKCVKTFSGHSSWIQGLFIINDNGNNTIFSASGDNDLRAWRYDKLLSNSFFKLITECEIYQKNNILSLDFSNLFKLDEEKKVTIEDCLDLVWNFMSQLDYSYNIDNDKNILHIEASQEMIDKILKLFNVFRLTNFQVHPKVENRKI